MKLNFIVFAIFLLIVALSHAQSNPDKEGDVYKLTSKNFENFVNYNDFVLVKFYARK